LTRFLDLDEALEELGYSSELDARDRLPLHPFARHGRVPTRRNRFGGRDQREVLLELVRTFGE